MADIPYQETAVELRVDGVADEAAWREARELGAFVTAEPSPGLAPSGPTRVRVLADREALYLFFEATDDRPERIRAGLARRDSARTDDRVGVLLDPSGEGQRAYLFFVTARGVQLDGTQSAGGDRSFAWDATWRSAARRTERGYAVEMAIPWRAVRHPARVEAIGLMAVRVQARTGEWSSFPAVDPAVPGVLAQLGRYRLDADLGRRAGLDLYPELTWARDQDGPLQERWGWQGLSPGLTVGLRPLPGASVLAAINPDFSQVESDAPRIELNRRYALYYDEKRPFFLEGREWFDSPAGDVIYTRSMVAPLAGLRATVERGGWTGAALGVLDAAPSASVSEGGGWTDDDLAGKRAEESVLRLRRALGRDAFVGLLYSDRTILGADLANRVGGLDGQVRLASNTTLSGGAMGSWTRFADGREAADAAGALGVERAGERVTAAAEATWIGPDFRAENGFVTRADVAGVEGILDFDFYPEGGVVRMVELSPVDSEFQWTTAGEPRLRLVTPNGFARFAGDNRAGIGADLGGEDYAGAWLPTRAPWAWARLAPWRWLLVRGGGHYGETPYYDPDAPRTGRSGLVRGSVTFEPVAAVSLTATGSYEDFRESGGGARLYRATVGRVRLETFATPELWARWIVDWNRVDDADHGVVEDGTRLEALFAWERGPGRAAWLGGSVDLGEETAWRVFAKASWVWSL